MTNNLTKKDYVLTIVDNLLKNKEIMSSDLQSLMQEVKTNIEQVPADTFFLESNMVMTETVSERKPNVSEPLFRLSEAYDELKRLAETNRESRPELLSAVTQLEGLLNSSEGYFPE